VIEGVDFDSRLRAATSVSSGRRFGEQTIGTFMSEFLSKRCRSVARYSTDIVISNLDFSLSQEL
jgi:hypothetical protein